ncbi:hypothetical protein GE21DRAFT_1340 [Neurospora crassa]|uniref:Uncharacterized protein n=1 Tax=Neurospora crassa (strain ATCC 24698 / 74-OR23-1A / CBS 708.71 / DSM 1257 / FGSC 987) TaxID=367110 RepID=Q7SDX6_NEUCR|nr:hypothetical protein NCU03279 [Neurospora crassa OR74A]EAA34969.1 hypothetical protein NCU03279 [Neurospora crassa OR74A]KHE78528.1 hypothetical protein GE21DRAFT_1340 [Neurospora crassa]|eukprot:XP_964205.1 hypothetical protein NCU03279 [Neurospora crassa OR74A]
MDETTTTPQRPSCRADTPRPSSADEANITSSSPTGSRFKPPKPKDVAVYEKKPLPPIPPKRRPAASISSQQDPNSVKIVYTLANIPGAGPPEKINNRQNLGDIDWEKEEAEINFIIAKQLTPRGGTPISTSAYPAPRTPKPLHIPPADSERTLKSSLSQEIISPQPRSPVSNILQLGSFGPNKSHPDSPPLSPIGQIYNLKVKQLSGPASLPGREDCFSNSENNATEKHTTGYISPVSSRSSFYSQYRDSTVSEAGSASLAGSSPPRRYDSPVLTEYFPRGKPHATIKNRLMVRKAPSPIPRPLQPRKIRGSLKGRRNKTARTMSPDPPTDSDHSGVSITEARELYHETTAPIARDTAAGGGESWAYPNALSHPPHPGSSVGIPSSQTAGGPGHARFLGEDGTPQTTGDSQRESRQPPPPVRPPRQDELPLALPRWDSAADTLVTSDLGRTEEGEPEPRSSSQFSRVSHQSPAGSSSPSPFLATSQNAALKTRPRNRAQTISVSSFDHHNELRRQWDSGSPQLEIGTPLPLALEDNLASITKFAKHGSHHIRNHSDGNYSPGGGDGENHTSLFRRSLVSKVFRRVSGSTPGGGGGGASPSLPTPTSTPATISTAMATERSPIKYQTAAERYHDQSCKTIAAVGATSSVHRPRTADSRDAAGPSSFSFPTASSTSSAVGFLLPQTLKKSALAQKTNELFVGGRLARKTKPGRKREDLKNSIRVLGDGARVEAPVEFVTGMDLLSLSEKPARQEGQGWL